MNATATHAPANLRCEYEQNPMPMDAAAPRLSWQLCDERIGAHQTAYQVLAADALETLAEDAGNVWDSGKQASDQSVLVPWGGSPLAARTRYWWKIRVWDADGQASPWSEPAWFETGTMGEAWQAAWIGADLAGSRDTGAPCPLLRRPFKLSSPAREARLYITAMGLYEAELNGKAVGDDVLRPGWTDYFTRLPYQVYDVTSQLAEGENVLGVMLGDGWACGHVAWLYRQNYTTDRPKLRCELHVTLADGSKQVIASDEDWRTRQSPIVSSDLLMGESYDARLEMLDWSTPGSADAGWSPVLTFDEKEVRLVPLLAPPVRRTQEISPVAAPTKQGRELIYDLGQNFAGRVRITVSGQRGAMVTLRHGEMLCDDGTLYTENLRSARATDTYTLAGRDQETFEPRFTFHGFRYVAVRLDGPPAEVVDLVGIVLHSDTPPTGTFECSDPMINQLQSNIQWGQRSNFLEAPTDCPQRNERLGWTGDAQVFVRTACFNMDVAGFFAKYTRDLRDAQASNGDGAYPNYAPDPDPNARDGGPAWADAGIICPWTIYRCYGDKDILTDHYESMASFIAYLERTSRDYVRCHERDHYHCYGDWLAIDAVSPGQAPTPKALIGTAYAAHCAELMTQIARLLGHSEDAQRFATVHGKFVDAFNREFVTPGGRVVGHTQTGYLLALAFDLLPEALRRPAANHLAQDIVARKYHLSTGFVGTPLLLPVLARFGHTDIAFRLLLQEGYPSWIYPIKQGATTMWERWNSYTKEHGFGDVGMNSFNHYAYGAVGEWMYGSLAGLDLDPSEPAFRKSFIHPTPYEGIDEARASLETPYGRLATSWKAPAGRFELDATIPANTTAAVRLPVPSDAAVRVNGLALEEASFASNVQRSGDSITLELRAGTYAFVADAGAVTI